MASEVAEHARERRGDSVQNLFGQAVTYRLMVESPEDQIESTERYFDEIVANFKIPYKLKYKSEKWK
jgi:hypothetical protein